MFRQGFRLHPCAFHPQNRNDRGLSAFRILADGLASLARIAFRIEGNTVTVQAADDGREPALGPFLDLLAADLAANPASLGPAEHARLAELTEGVLDDLDQEIEGPVSL